MDTELFMECEEEELEPWQQVDNNVEEDEVDFIDSYGDPVEDSPSPLPASETPPPTTLPTTTPTAPIAPSLPTVSVSSPVVPRPPAPAGPLVAPGITQGPPLILTQTPNGTFLLPAAPGPGNPPPILLTAQGFPVQTVVNPVTQLVLNLQPGQTVQPLTLIQPAPLSQLVRPGVGVSQILPQGPAIQTRPGTASPVGPGRPSSGFTTLQIPATLTIRTNPPAPAVNLQMTQVGGAKPLKLAGFPAHPSGSANGVAIATPPFPNSGNAAPGTAPLAVTRGLTPTPPAPAPPKVVMSVEDFYYGTFEGNVSLRGPKPPGAKPSIFKCQICFHQAEDNLRMMQHMYQHSEFVGGAGAAGGGDERRCCKYCYRHFSSSMQLQSHQEQVHGPALSSCMCRICEWAFISEPIFLNHMKSNHKPGEMPYVCQVCSYRSSFYSDLLQHFVSSHRDSRYLLCVFCLKVTRNPSSYQQHLLRHQINQAFHCNKCRLQFVFLKDKMQHKLENHRSFRRPAQLEGLPPGAKVTIRTYGKIRIQPPPAGGSIQAFQSPGPLLVQPTNILTNSQKQPIQKRLLLPKLPRPHPKKPVGKKAHVKSRDGGDRPVCLECGTDASDFASHYPTHVHCLLCPYSTCCSRAYASHMIHNHVPHSKDKPLPLHRQPPPCSFLLQCSQCDLIPQTGDHMADHLLLNPDHSSSTCQPRTYIEPDIQFCHDEELNCSEEEDSTQDDDLPEPSWTSAGHWKQPTESDPESTKFTITRFTQGSGPCHNLPKNNDAIDFFNLLFPSALVELITNETNAHAKTCQFLGTFSPDWSPVTTHEIKGFIGLVILMGIQNLPDPSHYWCWSQHDNSYTFYRAMSFRRFKQIAVNIRMGSFTTDECRSTSNANDSLHIFRPMLDILSSAMWDAYLPNCCLTIDRALLPSLEEEGRHVKGNPKTQPQVWLLCDSKSGYCHRFSIQMGEKIHQEPGFSVVPQLVEGLEEKHHQLYLASSLTSVPLMQKLLDQGIYASSSFPPQSPILPRKLWEEGQLEKAGDFLQWQFGPLLATRWKDAKEMGCLSTNAAPGQPDTVWRRSQTKVGELDPIQRPMAFCLLQENMRGVDICKQLLACNPLGGVPQDRHWRSLFWFLVNLSIVNAFIVLRESRKDNPPPWVQDGLFSQVNFRKRLGNQLAKCAQKYFETMEIASSRGMRGEAADEPVKQRHRMTKVSTISKRCRNCNVKNIRHESVYGCIICKVNLCKQPSCFWEFHSLSPLNKGSTKIGFVKDRISGAIELEDADDNMDEAMAPVEDLDFSEDEKVEELDEILASEASEDIKQDKVTKPTSQPGSTRDQAQPPTILPVVREREDFLTARQLRIALFALCDGIRQASQDFSTEPQLIQAWLKEGRKQLKSANQEQDIHAEGGERMVEWVLAMREQQLPITESNLFQKASMFKKKGGFSDSFRISYDWAVSFMLQHHLGLQSVGRVTTLGRILPHSLEDKAQCFTEFTQKLIQVHKLPEGSIAAMDELCLFVDFSLIEDKSNAAYRTEVLKLCGSSSPLITVYLAALADGTMLPSLVLVKGQLAEKVLPEYVLLEASTEGFLTEEALDLWTNRIWLRHMSTLNQPRKGMLVLDRHRDHVADPFLAAISGSSTLPAVIPAGCSFCLQPMDICIRPVLQRFLLSRWAKFNAGYQKEETSPDQFQANITQLLIDWLVEALTHLTERPQLLKKSFHLTGLLPRQGDEEETRSPAEVQADLLNSLAEALLGDEGLEPGSPDQLELEDEEETEEEQEEGEEAKGREGATAQEQEDGEEESTDTEDDREEDDNKTSETKIERGDEIGNEWKMADEGRMEYIETVGKEDDRMDES